MLLSDQIAEFFDHQYLLKEIIKVILMQILKSDNIFIFTWKGYAEDSTLQHILIFKICTREICKMFVYKHW